MKVPLKQLQQSGATNGQGPVWDTATGIWGPQNIKTMGGFENRTDSTLAFVDGTRTFTISGTFSIYLQNIKTVKTGPLSVVIPNTVGVHFIYFDNTGTLTSSTSVWDVTLDTIAMVATVYWSGTLGELGDERHGASRDRTLHAYLHNTRGSAWDNGLAGTFDSTTLSVATGAMWDEDIKHTITGPVTTCRVWYREPALQMVFLNGSTTPYATTSGLLAYDNAGTLTAVSVASYVMNWVYATNDIASPIAVVVGQSQSNSLNTTRASLQPTFPNMAVREWKLLYSVIYQRSGGGPDFIESTDYRSATSLPGAAVASLPASSVTFVPDGDIASTNVQNALTELDTEKVSNIGALLQYSNLATGLIRYWTLDGNSTESVVGTTSTDTDVTYSAGKIGQCATFNGTTSKVLTTIDGPIGASPFSFSFWTKPTPASPGGIVGWGAGGNSSMYAVRDGTNIIITNGLTSLAAISAPSAEWVHVTTTYDGVTWTTYRNGTLAASLALALITAQGPVRMGDSPRNPGVYPYAGQIDEVALWNRALSADEVAQVYNAGAGVTYPVAPKPALAVGLMGYWPLESTGRDLVTGTAPTTETAVAYGTGKIGNGATFNGTTSKITTPVMGPLGAAPRTVSCWFQSTGAQDKWICSYGAANTNQAFGLALTPGGTVIAASYVGTCVLGAVTAGQWYHAVAIYDGVNLRGYLNAVAATPTALAINTQPTVPFTIGSGVSAVYLSGKVDEVALWNRALSAGEIAQLYNAGAGLGYPLEPTYTSTGAAVVGNTLSLYPATLSTSGLVTAGNQTFGGTKTFARPIIADAIANTIGQGAADVCIKAGTTAPDGSVNAATELFSVRTGIGGTETKKFWVSKAGTVNIVDGASYWSIGPRAGGASTQLSISNGGANRLAIDSSTGAVWIRNGLKLTNPAESAIVFDIGGAGNITRNGYSSSVAVSGWSTFNFYGATSDATQTEIFIDGISPDRAALANNSSNMFKCTVVARDNTNNVSKGWEITGLIQRGANAAATTIDTTARTIFQLGTGANAWDAAASADTTYGSIKLTVTGAAATTIRWNAKLDRTMVNF